MGAPSHFRHAVITGASSGLGAAVARLLSESGCDLTLFGRNSTRLGGVADACRAGGSVVQAISCDVRDADRMAASLRDADRGKPIDLIVANAGIGGAYVLAGPSGESADLAREIIDVNVIGAINAISPLVPALLERRSGTVVIVSSLLAFQGMAEAPVYSASKAALRSYGEGLRRLMKPHGVSVLVVSPGFIATPMSASLPYATPFCIGADDAARRLLRGALARKRELVFPWQFRVALALASALPASLTDRALELGKRLAERPAR